MQSHPHTVPIEMPCAIKVSVQHSIFMTMQQYTAKNHYVDQFAKQCKFTAKSQQVKIQPIWRHIQFHVVVSYCQIIKLNYRMEIQMINRCTMPSVILAKLFLFCSVQCAVNHLCIPAVLWMLFILPDMRVTAVSPLLHACKTNFQYPQSSTAI